MDANRLEELRAEASHTRSRLELYRAKRYGGRATSDSRMRELELRAKTAADRLRAAARESEDPDG